MNWRKDQKDHINQLADEAKSILDNVANDVGIGETDPIKQAMKKLFWVKLRIHCAKKTANQNSA